MKVNNFDVSFYIFPEDIAKLFLWCPKCRNSFTLNPPAECPRCGTKLVTWEEFKKLKILKEVKKEVNN